MRVRILTIPVFKPSAPLLRTTILCLKRHDNMVSIDYFTERSCLCQSRVFRMKSVVKILPCPNVNEDLKIIIA